MALRQTFARAADGLRRRPGATAAAASTSTSASAPAPASTNAGVRWVWAGWLGFAAENLALSEHRTQLIAAFGGGEEGDRRYHLLYNALSSAACGSLLYGYLRYRNRGPRWAGFAGPPPHLKAAAVALQGLGLVGFSQLLPKAQVPVQVLVGGEADEVARPALAARFQARCPLDFHHGKPASVGEDEPWGWERVTRHGALWSLASLGVGTALTSPFAVNASFFGGTLLVAAVGSVHQVSSAGSSECGTDTRAPRTPASEDIWAAA